MVGLVCSQVSFKLSASSANNGNQKVMVQAGVV